MRLAAETADDLWEVEALFDLCFAPGREALSSYRLRDGVPPVADLCLTLRDDDRTLAGAIRLWPVVIVADTAPGSAAGPNLRVAGEASGLRRADGRREPGRGEGGPLGRAPAGAPDRGPDAPSLLLGPVAVHPTRQGEGLGALLVESALDRAAGWERVMLVGDAPYYARFGFRRLDSVVMPPPTNPDRVLGRALVPGGWDGIAGRVGRWPHAAQAREP